MAFMINGIPLTNRYFGSIGLPVIPEALQEMRVHTGPVGAPLGSSNGGLVGLQFRQGTDTILYAFDLQTDNLATPGRQVLQTTVQGFRNVVGTVGGPLPLGMRFFLAAQHTFAHNRQPLFLQAFRYDSLRTDHYGFYRPGIPLPGPIEFHTNYLHNNWLDRTIVQGTMTGAVGGIDLEMVGSYSFEESPNTTGWPNALTNALRRKRGSIDESRVSFGAFRATYSPMSSLTLSSTLALYHYVDRSYDPDYGDAWELYSDSLEARKKGYLTKEGNTGFRTRFVGPPSYTVIAGFPLFHEFAPNNRYAKRRHSFSLVSLDLSWKPISTLIFSVGGVFESWTMREFQLNSIGPLMDALHRATGAPRNPLTEEQRRIAYLRIGNIRNYGYSYRGEEQDQGLDAPRTPRFWSGYVDFEFKDTDIVLRLGGRLEGFDLRIPVMPLDTILAGRYLNFGLYPSTSLREVSLVQQQPTILLLPRVHFFYTINRSTSVSAGFGKYAQMVPLQQILFGNQELVRLIGSPVPSGYRLGTTFVGYLAQPERTDHFEASLRHAFSPRIHLSAGAYTVSSSNRLQLGHVRSGAGDSVYVALLNQGESFSKGAAMQLQVLDLRGVTLIASYGIAEAQGTSSHPISNRKQFTDFPDPPSPKRLEPLDFDVRHHASLLAEYRTPLEKCEMLGGISILSNITFSSGHRYTRLAEHRFVGAGTLWDVGVRALIDPRVEDPLEPTNASTTPATFNIDLRVAKCFLFGGLRLEAYLAVLNVLNSKHILNVYPNSGSAESDTWLKSQIAVTYYNQTPGYFEFYRTINSANRWAYYVATGNDLFGAPRQFRLGVQLSK
jgi:hypothetical protein